MRPVPRRARLRQAAGVAALGLGGAAAGSSDRPPAATPGDCAARGWHVTIKATRALLEINGRVPAGSRRAGGWRRRALGRETVDHTAAPSS